MKNAKAVLCLLALVSMSFSQTKIPMGKYATSYCNMIYNKIIPGFNDSKDKDVLTIFNCGYYVVRVFSPKQNAIVFEDTLKTGDETSMNLRIDNNVSIDIDSNTNTTMILFYNKLYTKNTYLVKKRSEINAN